MSAEFNRLKRYLASLGSKAEFRSEELLENLTPLYVSCRYQAYTAMLFHEERLLLFSRNDDEMTPDLVQSHAHILAEVYSIPLVFIFSSGTREFCVSLVKAHIAFIVLNQQCYVPDGIIAINEKVFGRGLRRNITFLSPLAQVILLYDLLHKELPQELPFQLLIKELPGMQKVYVTRAAQELQKTNLAMITSRGRSKSLAFVKPRKELWYDAQKYLRSPVIRRIRRTETSLGLPLAGISALAEFSNLNDDREQTRAIYSRDFDKHSEILEYSGEYLELWRYNPRLLCKNGKAVDELSLYLSLRDHQEPRVKGELERMMENFPW